MKYRYSKYTGEDLDELDLEELLSRLSDLLLSSGFDDPYGMPGDGRATRCRRCTTRSSRRCSNGGLLSDETLEQLLGKDWQRSRRRGRAARRADREDHREAAAAGLRHRPRRIVERRSGARGRSRARASAARKRRSSSRSPTRASTSSATARCAICSDRSARAASAGTTRARWPPASRRAARPSRTSSATR